MCDDGIDNDGDTLIDYPDDPGCSSVTDTDELGTIECDDGIDNDGDTFIDLTDPGCTGPSDISELGTVQCDDGFDNDGDTFIDFNDPGCTGPSDISELGPVECDDGFDNDGDTFIDFNDPGCTGPTDTDETNCGDAICEGGELCSTCSVDCGVCPGPISFDSAASAGSESKSVWNLTWGHTVSGTDRIIIVGVAERSFTVGGGMQVSSVTYGASSLILIGSAGQTNHDQDVSMWYLINPPIGTDTVNVTMSVPQILAAGSTSFNNVHQTSPLGTPATADSATVHTSPATVDVSSAADELVVDVASSWDPITVGAFQTQLWSQSSGAVRGGSSTEPGVPTVTMSWSISPIESWQIIAVSLKPAP